MPEEVNDAVDRIRLSGISAIGYHGVHDQERRDGQTFVADVVLRVDTRGAAEQDRIDLTVDYEGLVQQIVDVLSGSPVALIETLAERIATLALDRDIVRAVDVVVHKPEAPLGVAFTDVAVEIHRERVRSPARVRRGVPAHAVKAEPEPEVDTQPAPKPQPDAVRERDRRPMPTLADMVVPVPLVPAGSVPLPLAPMSPPVAAPGVVDVPGESEPPDRMDIVPQEPVEVVLALGSNMGSSQETLRRAIGELNAVDGFDVTAIAPLARTAAVGGLEQPDFLNTVVLGRTVLSARALLRACLGVEAMFGRVRDERWGPRVIDIDVIVHGSTVSSADDLELPHPRAHERAFVLAPWAHVAPSAVLPGLGGGPVAVLAETAPDRDGIRWMALDWWDVEARA